MLPGCMSEDSLDRSHDTMWVLSRREVLIKHDHDDVEDSGMLTRKTQGQTQEQRPKLAKRISNSLRFEVHARKCLA